MHNSQDVHDAHDMHDMDGAQDMRTWGPATCPTYAGHGGRRAGHAASVVTAVCDEPKCTTRTTRTTRTTCTIDPTTWSICGRLRQQATSCGACMYASRTSKGAHVHRGRSVGRPPLSRAWGAGRRRRRAVPPRASTRAPAGCRARCRGRAGPSGTRSAARPAPAAPPRARP